MHVFDGGDGATIDGNIISGNTIGVEFDNGATGGVITSNYIGLDDDAGEAIPNVDGVIVRANAGATIGGDISFDGNVVSGNTISGLTVRGETTILGNKIGTDRFGQTDIGNASGIIVTGGE